MAALLFLCGASLAHARPASDRAAAIARVLPFAERIEPVPPVSFRDGAEANVVEAWTDGTFYVLVTDDGLYAVGVESWRGEGLFAPQAPVPLDALVEAISHPPLPPPPPGFTVEVFADGPYSPTRLLPDGRGGLVVLARDGGIFRYDLATGDREQLQAPNYVGRPMDLQSDRAQDAAQGVALSPDGRLYVAVNTTEFAAESGGVAMHHASIFRSPPGNVRGTMQEWLHCVWPAATATYGHGISHMGFGGDGLLYVSSGSRTDADEAGVEPDKDPRGEVRLTSAMWRLDPSLDRATADDVEVYADGLRNAYGWAWLGDGRMVGIDSGPDANPPEELNFIVEGGHYGFPYRFSDWPVQPYPHVEPPPAGMAFVDPVLNVGPFAGGRPDRPIATFDPHSSPVGLADASGVLGQGTLLVARFGNLTMQTQLAAGKDVVAVKLLGQGEDGRERCEVRPWLTGIGRPIDVCVVGGKVYVAEFGRNRDWPAQMLPGRILVLTPTP